MTAETTVSECARPRAQQAPNVLTRRISLYLCRFPTLLRPRTGALRHDLLPLSLTHYPLKAAPERMPQVKKAELIEGVVYMGDLRDKRRAYCRNGVREYLVWLVTEARLEWFCLEDDDYRPQLPDAQGVLHSRVFPGLRLPVAPLLPGDTAKVLAALTDTDLEAAKGG